MRLIPTVRGADEYIARLRGLLARGLVRAGQAADCSEGRERHMMRALSDHVLSRLNAAGLHEDVPTINLVADILQICSHEASLWSNCEDDAIRIPDVLQDAEREVRKTARSLSARRADIIIRDCEVALDGWTPQEENNEPHVRTAAQSDHAESDHRAEK